MNETLKNIWLVIVAVIVIIIGLGFSAVSIIISYKVLMTIWAGIKIITGIN